MFISEDYGIEKLRGGMYKVFFGKATEQLHGVTVELIGIPGKKEKNGKKKKSKA